MHLSMVLNKVCIESGQDWALVKFNSQRGFYARIVQEEDEVDLVDALLGEKDVALLVVSGQFD